MFGWFKKIFGLSSPEPLVPEKIFEKMTVAEAGTNARKLMENPLWLEIYADLKRDAFKVWADTDANDSKTREFLYHHVRALVQLEGRIGRYISNATLNEQFEEQSLRYPPGNLGAEKNKSGG